MATASKAAAVKRKRWVTITAPKLFNEAPIGESYVLEPSELIGKVVRTSISSLTGESSRQYTSAGFAITGAVGDKLTTQIKYYKVLPSSLRRLVRRGKERMDESFVVTCKDGKQYRVKPFVVARSKMTGSTLAAMRKAIQETFVKNAASNTHEQYFLDIITNKVQRATVDSVRKVYPLSSLEVRWLELLPGTVEAPVVKEEEKTEKKQETKPEAEKPESKETEDDEEPAQEQAEA